MTRLRIGGEYRVTFRDHCEVSGRGSRKSVRCMVWGKLVDFSVRDLTLRAWEAQFRSSTDRRMNATDFTIVRAAIEKVEELTQKQGK